MTKKVLDNVGLTYFWGKIKSAFASKVPSATDGNLAGLDSSGNLTDSGHSVSEFATSEQAVPSGGTAGQLLAKASDSDNDLEWVDSSDIGSQSDWEEDDSTEPSYVQNRPAVRAGTGDNAVIEGNVTKNVASGDCSHAEGYNSVALGDYSHSEGINTRAFGQHSHAECGGGTYKSAPFTISGEADTIYYSTSNSIGVYIGLVLKYNDVLATIDEIYDFNGTTWITLSNTLSSEALTNVTVLIGQGSASGLASHSEGTSCLAGGNCSHAEGFYTVAQNNYEHSQGKYNKSNRTNTTFGDSGNTIHSIGIGTEESNRKNAVEVMQNGDVYVYGLGSYDGTNIASASTLQDVVGTGASITVDDELSDTSENPVQNKVTKAAIDSKQDIISDLDTIRSGAALGATSIQSSEKGVASGVATLDSGGKVPQSQLPSYVDDVLEYVNLSSFPATGESGKIYVSLDTNKTYRWSGSAYVEIAQGLALGETSSTAFAGDRGKAIEDKIPSSASSSNKLATASDVSAKYTKPSTGIPKTDLASAVQTSLGKADTALQSYTETDPVFTASAAHGISSTDISNWNAKGTYSKPSGGIPKTDLASAVQTSLDKADTALQSYTETDPTVPSWAKQSTKPSYDYSEIGNTPTIPTVPTNVSAFTNDAGYITSSGVVTIYSGSTTPSSSLGSNGDIYIKTT